MKKVQCDKCGKSFKASGLGPHKKHCKGVKEAKPKRKYTKRQGSSRVVYADVRMEIDLTRALKLGIAKIVQE